MYPPKTLKESALLFLAVMGALFFASLLGWNAVFRYIEFPTCIDIAHKFGLRAPPGQLSISIVQENALSIFFALLGMLSCICAGFYGNSLFSNKIAKTFVYLFALFGFLLSCYWCYLVVSQQSILPLKNGMLVDYAIRKTPLYFVIVSILLLINFILYRLKSLGERLGFFAYALFFLYLFSLLLVSNMNAIVAMTHFEVFAFPIVQEWLGGGISSGQLSQYGLYPILLKPIWILTDGASTKSIVSVMYVLLAFSFFCFFAFTVKKTKNVLQSMQVLTIGFLICLLSVSFWPSDLYFQFFPLRILFPSIFLLVSEWDNGPLWKRIICAILLGLGLLWNLESSILAAIFYISYKSTAFFKGGFIDLLRMAFIHTTRLLIYLTIFFAVFFIVYFFATDHGFDFGRYFIMLRMFAAGIYFFPAPKFGMWEVPFVLYLFSIFYSSKHLILCDIQKDKNKYAALFSLAVSGIFLLKYYEVRGVSLPLAFSSIYAPLCAAILIDDCFSRSRINIVVTTLISSLVIGSVLGWLISKPIEPIHSQNLKAFMSGQKRGLDLVVDDIMNEFGRVKNKSTDELFVISPYSYLVQERLNKPSPIKAAGMCQLWFDQDIMQIVSEIKKPTTKMVVLDSTPGCPMPELNDDRIQKVLASEFHEVDGIQRSTIFPVPAQKIYIRN